MDDGKYAGRSDYNHVVNVEVSSKDDGGLYINVDGKNAHLTKEQADALKEELNENKEQ